MFDEEKYRQILKSKNTKRYRAIGLQLTPNVDEFAVAGVVYMNQKNKLVVQVMYN